MTKDPAVLFYTSDFISGTELFTYEQKGQYIHLLCVQHQNGHLPTEYMKKVLGENGNIVWSKFSQDEQGLWYQQRMDIEKDRRKKYTESRRKNVLVRYKDRYVTTYEGSYVDGMKPHMETVTETITDTINKTKKETIKFIPPKFEEVNKYCLERGNGIKADCFIDYYETRGWMIGKNKIKNWKACIRTWERRNKNKDNTWQGNGWGGEAEKL